MIREHLDSECQPVRWVGDVSVKMDLRKDKKTPYRHRKRGEKNMRKNRGSTSVREGVDDPC